MLTRSFMLIGLLLFSGLTVQADEVATAMPEPTLESVRSNLHNYLDSMKNFRARVKATEVTQLSNERISEETWMVECMVRDGVIRGNRYAVAFVDGKRSWYDIRETVMFPSGALFEWRHPGFPGTFSFGVDSKNRRTLQVLLRARDFADPLQPMRTVARIADMPTAKLLKFDENRIVVRAYALNHNEVKTDGPDQDFIDLVYARDFADLPISLTRTRPDSPEVRLSFQSGSGLKLDYRKTEDGKIYPLAFRNETPLVENATGVLARIWDYTEFSADQTPTVAQMQMTLPTGIAAVELDSGREFTLADAQDEEFLKIKALYGDYITMVSRIEAKRKVAKSFVGQSPDLPEEYEALRNQVEPEVSQASRTSKTIVAIHGCAVLAIAWLVLRRPKEAEGVATAPSSDSKEI
ncbi:MAG: hypothetical protein R3C49_09085 [Planctomycetaceae bacterium]